MEEIEVEITEAARILNVTPRAIQKQFEAGKIKGRFVKSGKGGGKKGGKLLVTIKKPPTNQKVEKDRYKIHRGEAGCNVITEFKDGKPIINIEAYKPETRRHGDPETRRSGDIETKPTDNGGGDLISAGQSAVPVNRESPQAILSAPPSPPQPCGVTTPAPQGTFLPVVQSQNPNLQEEGYLKFAILRAWREKISENHKPKGKATQDFLEMYNRGLLLPEIYKNIGPKQRSTLYKWDLAERLGGVPALIPQYRRPDPSPITDYEKYILLNCLLHQNRLKIGTAIKFTKTFFGYKKYPSPSSESKLRRFADDFRKTNYPTWVMAREGAKALNDKCLPYAERDWRLLTVGEGLVADGHRLNFQVINPFTGKPCRATIVLFWDWKSAYPVGWEIMIEENVQCIASALRNAILTLGKIPKWLLIDSGKAFKAKCFTSEIELEDGILYGMFATLGIHTHFSQAYNPQEKPLERFWGTFNNWFERLFDSYTGASIEDKPAWMKRNEKDAQARHKGQVPKIEDVQEALKKWIGFYAEQPSRGRDGMKPGEIFEAEKGPGVDPGELYHLMMVKEKMQVHRNGVTFNNWHYYDEALSDIKDYVIGKYSLSDYSQIYCFYKGQFRCVAKPIERVHPMASESECPKDHEAHKRVGAHRSRIKRTAKNLLALVETGNCGDLEHTFRKSPEVADVVKAIEDKRKPVEKMSPFVDEDLPTPRLRQAGEEETRRSELSVPAFDHDFEYYDWYMAQDPKSLNRADRAWIADYMKTEQWEKFYGKKHAIGGET